jgi:hypothetical protein
VLGCVAMGALRVECVSIERKWGAVAFRGWKAAGDARSSVRVLPWPMGGLLSSRAPGLWSEVIVEPQPLPVLLPWGVGVLHARRPPPDF